MFWVVNKVLHRTCINSEAHIQITGTENRKALSWNLGPWEGAGCTQSRTPLWGGLLAWKPGMHGQFTASVTLIFLGQRLPSPQWAKPQMRRAWSHTALTHLWVPSPGGEKMRPHSCKPRALHREMMSSADIHPPFSTLVQGYLKSLSFVQFQ